MKTIDLNADMGESFGPWKMGDDAALLDIVTSANVACGWHAGDADTMAKTMALAAQKGLMRGPEEALYSDLSAMRTAARDFLTGTKRPRAWLAAYYWSSMAAAAGDAAGAALRDEVVETMRLRGDADAWTKEASSIDAGVLRDWIGKDVPARLR